MLTEFLIRKFIPKSDENIRQSYGYLGGVVGIIANIALFVTKLFIGIVVNSVAITADAFNNLSDVGSSIITIIGFKIATKPADSDHPFGHGRGEYIAGLVVSVLIIIVGYEFVRSSIERVRHPSPLIFNLPSLIVLILSSLVKIWLSRFNGRLGREINSGTLNATSFDSFADVIITGTVALSLLISRFTAFPFDGYIGLVVSGFILYAGYNLVKDTVNPLIGEAPPADLVNSIIKEVVSFEGIIGAHEPIVHSYGPSKYIATIHAEVPSNLPMLDAHEIIDIAENKISKKLGINLIIHMDPVNVDNREIEETKAEIEEILKEFPQILSIHDFRFVGREPHKNILFDIIVCNTLTPQREKQFLELIKGRIKSKHPEYDVIIGLDRDYVQISKCPH